MLRYEELKLMDDEELLQQDDVVVTPSVRLPRVPQMNILWYVPEHTKAMLPDGRVFIREYGDEDGYWMSAAIIRAV